MINDGFTACFVATLTVKTRYRALRIASILAMDLASGALTAAAAVAAGAYLNAKLTIGTDLTRLRHDRTWIKRLLSRIEESGDTCTTYAMFDKVNEGIEFLWFEGRTWTYGEMKQGKRSMILSIQHF